MNIPSQINDILKNKSSIDKLAPFNKLFGQFGIGVIILGILFSLVKGIEISEYDGWLGFLIIVGGGIVSWVVGMMILGFAALIDGVLKMQAYMRIFLEYTATQNGHPIDVWAENTKSEYESPAKKLPPIIVEDKKGTWMCPSCGAYNDFKFRVCDCGYVVPNDFELQLPTNDT